MLYGDLWNVVAGSVEAAAQVHVCEFIQSEVFEAGRRSFSNVERKVLRERLNLVSTRSSGIRSSS